MAAHRYQPRYCEENAWHLCAEPEVAEADPSVVIVSNAGGAVAMWGQRAAEPDAPIAWDYHVFVIARTDGWQVWDLDTRLGLPVDLDRYLSLSFATVGVQASSLDPRFRVVAAEDYRAELRSDRSHMRRQGGGWLAPPPPWPPIGDPDSPPNFARFIDLDDPFLGHVVDLAGLRALFDRAR